MLMEYLIENLFVYGSQAYTLLETDQTVFN